MERIASFTVDHNMLSKGMYISRIDFGDLVTYDIRMKAPNGGDYLTCGAAHTFEHLFATYARNSQWKDHIAYVGPMGCMTGFYLLTKGLPHEHALQLVQDTLAFVREFEGEIPGSKKEECGNYQLHDLPQAKAIATDMLQALENWNVDKMDYAYHQ